MSICTGLARSPVLNNYSQSRGLISPLFDAGSNKRFISTVAFISLRKAGGAQTITNTLES